jgi:hypothetical protein
MKKIVFALLLFYTFISNANFIFPHSVSFANTTVESVNGLSFDWKKTITFSSDLNGLDAMIPNVNYLLSTIKISINPTNNFYVDAIYQYTDPSSEIKHTIELATIFSETVPVKGFFRESVGPYNKVYWCVVSKTNDCVYKESPAQSI